MNIKYLGHELERYDNFIYICYKCNTECFAEDIYLNKLFYLDKTGKISEYRDLISCDEMIIKGLLE